MSELLKKVFWFGSLLFVLSACSSPRFSSIQLRIPNGFRGEIFICEGRNVGSDFNGRFVMVDEFGMGFVPSFKNLEQFRPDRILAVDTNGMIYENSVLSGGDTVSLWPISHVEGHFFYFVIGSFDEKTELENKRIASGYLDVIERVKRIQAAKRE